jgi:succinate dehydrogenase/fumarate reductase flavoprotein subunit
LRKKRGARIENHLPLTEVITKDGEVIGAIGISIKDEKPVVKLFRTKCVVLATGTANRLYPPVSPGWIFNTAFCPSDTGSGRAMAYRAGGKLVNMEIPNTHAGPKYLARCGKATWIGVYKDPYGKPVGPFVQKPTRELGDITADVWNSVFTDYHKSGRGPVYIDCTNTSKEDLEYMMWGLEHEGNTAMLHYMAEEGIDLRKHCIEFMKYEPFLIGSRGIEIDTSAETNIKGLYAAGDEVGNFRADIAGAATFGWIAGKSAAERAVKVKKFDKAENNVLVKDRTKFYTEILERKSGPSWKEANLALQQIMNDYAGITVRSETLLKAGLKYLRDLKGKVLTTLAAENSHTLMRGLETIDLIECGETIFLTALERKETRGLHIRSDFPFTNPLLQDRFLTIRQEKGKVQLEWRDRK